MSIFDATILGVLQGVTEFVPVSSSGHLILAREVLGAEFAQGLAFDAVLQLATAFSILVYFWADLRDVALRLVFKRDAKKGADTLLWALVLGTIPAVVAGLMLESYMETMFRTPIVVVGALTAGSVLMAGAEKLAKHAKELSISRGFSIGLYQTLALVPGVSRSGATISGGLFSGLTREKATRFAFLLGFPILFGSGAKKLWELIVTGAVESMGISLFVGAIVSFVVGLAAIHFLLRYLEDNSLYVFVWYRLIVAGVALIFVI